MIGGEFVGFGTNPTARNVRRMADGILWRIPSRLARNRNSDGRNESGIHATIIGQ